MNARVSSHVGSRPAARTCVERGRVAVAVGHDRLAVGGGPGDVQRRVERVDGVLAARVVARRAQVHHRRIIFQRKESVAQALGEVDRPAVAGRRAPPRPSCPNVGEPTRMSTTTSNTDPCRHVTYLAWLGGSCAKCTPRSTPADDTEQLAWCRSNRCPANCGERRIGEPFEEHPTRVGVQLRRDLPRAGHGQFADLHWPRSA